MASTFSRQDERDVKKLLESARYDEVVEIANAELKAWKDKQLNIAVTGESGSGKSTFINTIRDLTADDRGAAEVNVKEQTMQPRPYKHPTNDNLIYWDLPGVGTKKFPIEKYSADMNLRRFEFFLIISSERFSSYDISLANEIKRLGRKFYFIRSKIDSELTGQRRSHPKSFDETQVLRTIRKDIKEGLRKEDLGDTKVFLVDLYETTTFDFPELVDAIASDHVGIVKEAFLYGLNVYSKQILSKKEHTLRERIKNVALQASLTSGLVSLVPLAGAAVSTLIDIDTIKNEMIFYRNQLGLDEGSLRRLAEKVNKDYRHVQADINTGPITDDNITAMLGPARLTGGTIVRAIPFFGTIWATSATYTNVYNILDSYLWRMVREAHLLLDRAFGQDK